MQIYVCIKHVPDTAAQITLVGEDGYDDTACRFIASPYDEYALEQAVQMVEADGGEVVVVTVGKEAAAATIRGAMAMGAHRGILVVTDRLFLDSRVTAAALCKAIEGDGRADLIFTGKGSVDTEGFQTQYRLAASMGLPVINEVASLEAADGRVTAQREIGGGDREVVRAALPCVLGATKGLNEPRYPKFPDIMKARKKPIEQIPLAELGIESAADGIRLLKLEAVPERSGARMIEGDVDTQVAELVRILDEDENVI